VGSGPTPLFRRAFRLSAVPTSATLRVCGLGQFESRVNSARVGDDVLAPGWTNYRKTCLYLTRDVTTLLRTGDNVLAIQLGNGMYHVPGGRYAKFVASFGPLKLIARLDVELADGGGLTIVSDEAWRVATGPITFSCIYGGEDHDARLEPRDWAEPGFDDGAWTHARITEGPGGKLVEQAYPSIRVMQTFAARSFTNPADRVRVYDCGQNMSGRPALTIRATRPGATVTLATGEQLDADGRVSQVNTGTPVTFTYTSDGRAARWAPQFALTGFRYVEATGDVDQIERIEGEFVHCSASVVGDFACSNGLLNRTHALILAAIKSNTHSVFTDCPHREKLGWLEVPHLMGPSILYNLGVAPLFEKMLADIRDAQHADGCVPTIAPQFTVFEPPDGTLFNDSPEWGAACVLAPWFVYRHTGDVTIVRDNYETMCRFVDYIASRAGPDGIVAYGLGDWYDIGPGEPGYGKNTTLGVTATAVFAQCLQAITRFARLLGQDDDAIHFDRRFAAVREAFNARFFDANAGHYDRGSQTAQAMPLAIGLVPPGDRQRVLDTLVADVRAHRNHITAGDIGYRYVLAALAEAGRSDVIFDMLSRTDAPSYGAQLATGATTLTEAWDANPRSSLNHMMLGHAAEWFFRYLAGIRIDLAATDGAPQVVIDPHAVGDVAWCRAHHDVPAGRIAVAWERHGDRVTVRATLPPGLRAAAWRKGRPEPLDAGCQTFEIPIDGRAAQMRRQSMVATEATEPSEIVAAGRPTERA
jgi:hypothetical protein